MKFEKWFVEQHGKRPSELSITELAEIFKTKDRIANISREIYLSTISWEERKTSAQYAWNIKDKDKLTGGGR